MLLGQHFLKMNWEYSGASTESIFDQTYIGFYTSLGLDYHPKKDFCHSTNIGYFTNGAKGTVSYLDELGNITGLSNNRMKLP